MQTIIIDEEIRSLLPELGRATFELLEENLLENGCRDALVVWGDILIDGHNRYEICMKHDIPFNTVNKDFESRAEALIWIISTQVARRNLTPIQLSHYRGLHYRASKMIQGSYDRSSQKLNNPQNGDFSRTTVSSLADQYKVSKNTIGRDAKVSEAIDAIGETSLEAKRMILSGEVNIGKQALESLSGKPKKLIEEIALEIAEGSFDRKLLSRKLSGEDAASTYPVTAGLASADSISVGFPLPHAAISTITDGFNTELRRLTKSSDSDELKTALRSFIDTLEELYTQI